MLDRVRLWWSRLSDSLWFVPAAMILGSTLLAVAMVSLSEIVDDEMIGNYPRIFGASAQSSREMLSTIAGAMMTVAGVTFSITILAVAQASSQYTPRILRNFMRDRANQVTLGTLTGVFVYCLIVLRTVRGDEDQPFVPALAVLVAFALAIVAIGVLVFFIHHIASALQASHILARVRTDTITAVDTLFPEDVGEEAVDEHWPLPPAHAWRTVRARHTGYISHVDADGLLATAESLDVVVRMERGIGEHVIAGTPIFSVTAVVVEDDLEKRLNRCVDVSSYRTVDQDPAFGFRQMVDMAVKALSPGVNDTTTAVGSIDAIGAALVRLADRRIEHRYRLCDGTLRVIADGPTFTSLVDTALNEIRQNADGNVSVLARLLATIEVVVGVTPNASRRQLLLDHASRILAAGERSVPDEQDRAELRRAFESERDAVGRV